MNALSLVSAVRVEEPGLGLIEILIVDRLSAGLHHAVLSKVKVCGSSVLKRYLLKTGLHLSAGVEAITAGLHAECLDAGLCVVRCTVFEVKLEELAFLADLRSALDRVPAVCALSVLLIVLIGRDLRYRSSRCIGGVGCGGKVILALGSGCICRIRSRKLIPAGL